MLPIFSFLLHFQSFSHPTLDCFGSAVQASFEGPTLAALVGEPANVSTALTDFGMVHWAKQVFGPERFGQENEKLQGSALEPDEEAYLKTLFPCNISNLSPVQVAQHRVFWEAEQLRTRVADLQLELQRKRQKDASRQFPRPAAAPAPASPESSEAIPGNMGKLAQLAFGYAAAARAGDATAQYNLGACLFKGYGCKKDLKQAVYWYRESSRQGYAPAQAALAGRYYGGDKVCSSPSVMISTKTCFSFIFV